MSNCECKWKLYEDESVLCEECKEVLDHPHELSKELIRTQAKVKELEAELCKLKRSYDIMSAYAVHYVPEQKTQELIKDVNKAYE